MNKTEQELVSEERGKNYGNFNKMAADAQALKCMLVSANMDAVQREAMQMICTKLARIANGDPNYLDSWFDIAGYANLVVKDLASSKIAEEEIKFTAVFGARPADE